MVNETVFCIRLIILSATISPLNNVLAVSTQIGILGICSGN